MKDKFTTSVIEFMTKFEQTVQTEQTIPPKETKILRFRLIQEELSELLEAYFLKEYSHDDYLIETADAICDMIYVLYGIYADYGNYVTDFREETFNEIVFQYATEPTDKELYLELLTFNILPNFIGSLYISMINDDFNSISLGIWLIEKALLKLSNLYGFPIEELFDEVHRSNMSKLHNGVVVKNEHGKVVKSPEYSPADIRGILEKNSLLSK